MAEGSIMEEMDDNVPSQCVREWMRRMERMVRMVKASHQNDGNPPHKYPCILNDTFLSRSLFLSTGSLFLSPKELRIIGYVQP
jgi:hypothetical protein